MSPNQRAWARFRRNRLGYVSLWIFVAHAGAGHLAELVSNDRPLRRPHRRPVVRSRCSATRREKALGGDFGTPTDWKDPFIAELLAKPGNWALGTLNPHSATSIDYFAKAAAAGRRPARRNWLGTDGKGRDMVARLLYGFRVSIWFALALTVGRHRDRHRRRARCRATSAAGSTSCCSASSRSGARCPSCTC